MRDDDDVRRRRAITWTVLLCALAACTGSSRQASAADHLLRTQDLRSDAAALHAKDDYSTGKDYGVLTRAELDPTDRGPSKAPDPNLAAARLGVVRTWARSPNGDGTAAAERVNAIQSMYLEFPDASAAEAAAKSLERAVAASHTPERSGDTTFLMPTGKASIEDPRQWIGLHRHGPDLTIVQMMSTTDDDLQGDLRELVSAAIRRGG